VHWCRNVEEKLTLCRAESAPTESVRRMTTASERSNSKDAASSARTQAKAFWSRCCGQAGK
jgi:hypothetical protein